MEAPMDLDDRRGLQHARGPQSSLLLGNSIFASTNSPPPASQPRRSNIPQRLNQSTTTITTTTNTGNKPGKGPLLRKALLRRRSSFPPDPTPGSSPIDPVDGVEDSSPARYPVSGLNLYSSNGTDQTQHELASNLFADLGFPELGSGVETDSMWTQPAGWNSRLDFEANIYAAGPSGSSSQQIPQPLPPRSTYSNANPGSSSNSPPYAASSSSGSHGGQAMARVKSDPGRLEPGKIAQFGNDLAWRTILASQVEVEGVGQVTAARVLQEIWKRGGGDQVSNQKSWPTIIMALSLPEFDSPSPGNFPSGLPLPTAHASQALANLYNLSLRHWEPSIFSGLLSSFGGNGLGMDGGMTLTAMLGAAVTSHHQSQQQQQPATFSQMAVGGGDEFGGFAGFDDEGNFGNGVFGISTPQKELDLSQWTQNLTPGTEWNFINSTFPPLADSAPPGHLNTGNNGSNPRAVSGSGPGPSSLAFEVRDRRESAGGVLDDEGIRGLDEILAQMEEEGEAQRMELAAMASQQNSLTSPQLSSPPQLPGHRHPKSPITGGHAAFQMSTPETDSSGMTGLSDRAKSVSSAPTDHSSRTIDILTPPSSEPSPFAAPVKPPKHAMAAAVKPQTTPHLSLTGRNAQLPTPAASSTSIPKASLTSRHPMQLTMPTSKFVPPPPMCMFFNPGFHDMEHGKIGVWKGDLHVRGKGGGKFSVLIVGEESTGHLWQSHLWPTSIAYPPEPATNEHSVATSSMIPVAHLAREGFTPAAMGMVLCNDSNIQEYVNMVQGFHAEGVAFHLGTVNRLPIVFLPAKFNTADPLQRLGVAFMTKADMPLPPNPIPAKHAMDALSNAQSQPRYNKSSAASTPASEAKKVLSQEPKKKKRRQSAPAGTLPPPTTARAHRKRDSVALGRKGIVEDAILEGA